ncbi:MAG: DUF3616 domain-containing protein [Chloroflexi bacterium]|nr:DUF3616 domain-containing protein [Chloroflexota bacterium]
MCSEVLQALASVKLSGVKAPKDISAIAKTGPFLVIGSDEGVGQDKNENIIQLLEEVEADHYNVSNDILLFKGNDTDGNELDIEGIAVEGNKVYVVGSHSLRRRKVDTSKRYQKNRESFRAEAIDGQKNRAWLYRLAINSEGKETDRARISLRDIIQNDGVLKMFSKIPSKENGIDIEGIAVKGEWLYVGFRGPVFRENYVPVMKLKFDQPEETYELLYVKLGGYGFRDIESVSDGFLIVAGPVGDGSTSYPLYHWDGKDIVIGEDRATQDIGKMRLLAEIQPPEGGKAEGMVVLQEQDTWYELLIIYDGVKDDVAQRFRVDKKLN